MKKLNQETGRLRKNWYLCLYILYLFLQKNINCIGQKLYKFTKSLPIYNIAYNRKMHVMHTKPLVNITKKIEM